MAEIIERIEHEEFKIPIVYYPKKEILNKIYNSRETALKEDIEAILKNGYYCAALCDAYDVNSMKIQHKGKIVEINRGTSQPDMTIKELLFELAKLRD